MQYLARYVIFLFILGDGKALAPIFGKKKPRQALLTHPNNSQPKTAPSASYGGMYTYNNCMQNKKY